MEITHVTAVSFSPTGNTRQAALALAGLLAEELGAPRSELDITLPAAREGVHTFSPGELVVFAVPVYAGRVPNKLLPYVQTGFAGGGALAVPLVTFGNRSFDDGLMELRCELETAGFHTVAGAALACAHVFSPRIAPGRPDGADLAALDAFARSAAEKIRALDAPPAPVAVAGNDPVGPYYTPLGVDGQPARFLKAKPKTDPARCRGCGLCAQVCPMGSIDPADPAQVSGICIKCQACIHKCPAGAKYFDDPAFLSHVAMLEQTFTEPKKNEVFL